MKKIIILATAQLDCEYGYPIDFKVRMYEREDFKKAQDDFKELQSRGSYDFVQLDEDWDISNLISSETFFV